VTLTYIREGRIMEADIGLELAPPHFESAQPLKMKSLGLTLKDLTYEVRTFFRLGPDEPGLVVAGVEPGGKAAVGKIMPYSLVRKVNDRPVTTTVQFKEAVDAVQKGPAPRVVELTVELLGKTRVVKLSL
jgi:S1-C subfamily serine protease